MNQKKLFYYLALVWIFFVLISSIFTPLFVKSSPFDIAAIELSNAELPPAWIEGGSKEFIFGTDIQGRGIFSTLLYSMRISLFIAVCAVLASMVIGVILGLISGYYGGLLDAIVMRIVDIKLALPAILIAMLVGGIMRNVFEVENLWVSLIIIIFALTFATWSIYTRAVRSIVIREKEKEYVSAARLMGISNFRIISNHIVPNIKPLVGVLMIIDFANCILLEATLSFLGLGLPPVVPSLGTTIRVGANYLLSGSWWIATFPALTLVLIIYCVNIIKDYLQEYKY